MGAQGAYRLTAQNGGFRPGQMLRAGQSERLPLLEYCEGALRGWDGCDRNG